MADMAETPRSPLSSAFDDMLAQNKKRFDDLYRGGHPLAGGMTSRTAAIPGPAPRAAEAAGTPPGRDSAAVRQLNERFGTDWRFEVAEKQRTEDEAIVLCKLFFGKAGAVRTQFGRARLAHGPLAGASGGVRFRIVTSGDDDEAAAFRKATEAALLNCIALI